MANSGGNNVMARLKGRCMSEKVKLHAAMIALQFGYAGFHIVSRAALNMGVSKVVYPIYRNVIALLLLGPCAYFVEKNERPALTLSFLIQFFLLALCGITANQGFYLLGLYYTSPTFASAIQNSVPAITFVMAASLRFETVSVRRKDGIAKIIGTMACVGGATVITLYKGPPLSDSWQSAKLEPLNSFKTLQGQQHHISSNSENWTLGCIYLLGNCLTWSAWIVLQAPLLKKYPARLSVTSFTCFFGVIQFLIIAAFVERDIQHWKIASTEELFTILYAGCVASGIAFSVQIWCIDRGGPVFVAVYQPVQTLLVAIMASLILGEKFYLGAVFGAVIIVAGLYLVLWGKSKEKKLALMETKPCSTSREECSAVIISGNISDHKNDDPALTQPLLIALKRCSPASELAEP